MQTHNLVQRTPQWHAHRSQHWNASDAPAMMGVSSNKQRNELLHELWLGGREISDYVQAHILDPGNKFELWARPLAENIVGGDLYPVVGSEGRLSASFDGITADECEAFEHKRLNAALRAAFADIATVSPEHRDSRAGSLLTLEYQVQMEQQCMVSACERVLFMASEWTDDGVLVEEHHCWYYPNPVLAARIRDGWFQFERDLAAYQPPARADVVVARTQEHLPAVSVQVNGSLVVHSNLPAFGLALRRFIARMPEKPSTDQEFADTDAACKALKKAEEALEQSETSALAQLADVNDLRRVVAELRSLARDTRLAREKLVARRKTEIRDEEVVRGHDAMVAHIQALNFDLGGAYIDGLTRGRFSEVIKGLRSFDSLRNAIDTEVAAAKIEADALHQRIAKNIHAIRDAGLPALFADQKTLVLKDPEAVAAIVAGRVNEHRAAEQRRLDAERERIRAEEVSRLAREASAAEDARRAAAFAQAVPVQNSQRQESGAQPSGDAGNMAHQTAQAAPGGGQAEGAAAASAAVAPGLLQFARENVELTHRLAGMEVKDLGRPAESDPADAAASISMGDIHAKLGFTLSSGFITNTLGIAPSVIKRPNVLYTPAQLRQIKVLLKAHIERVL